MDLDLFAGNPVTHYERAVAWYTRLLGSEPSFLPNPTEAVWQVDDHGFLYIDVRPDDAAHAMCTLFVEDLDARLTEIARRGIKPTEVETYESGVRKAVFHDPDGNEIGLGGGQRTNEARSEHAANSTLDDVLERISQHSGVAGRHSTTRLARLALNATVADRNQPSAVAHTH